MTISVQADASRRQSAQSFESCECHAALSGVLTMAPAESHQNMCNWKGETGRRPIASRCGKHPTRSLRCAKLVGDCCESGNDDGSASATAP